MIRTKSEDAVSPVIGVMLMLVVTIVIAAVVAVFASGVGMDSEPAPATVVDVVGVYSGSIEVIGGWTINSEAGWQRGSYFYGDEDGNKLDDQDSESNGYDSGTDGVYRYYYDQTVGETAVFGRMQDVDSYYTPFGSQDLQDKFLEWETESVNGEYEPSVQITCLHGEVLDLSKIIIKVPYGDGFIEGPLTPLTGILSPGDTLKIPLSNEMDGNQYPIMLGNVVDIVVYYGSHKIAEAENLRVTQD